MGAYAGDFLKGSTVRFLWNSFSAAGASITRSTNGTVSVYEDGGATQFTTGVTDTEDFDGLTGVHMVAVDTSQSEYERGKDYHVVLSGATIDGQTVNAHLFSFSIENRAASKNRILANGAARAGSTASTIVLASGAVSADDQFNLYLVRNATTGEVRIITDTDNATDSLTVYPDWRTTPALDDAYVIEAPSPFAVADLPAVDANGYVTLGSLLSTALTAASAANLQTFFHSNGNALSVLLEQLNAAAGDAKTNTDDIATRLPASLQGGRISANIDAIATDPDAATFLAAGAGAMVSGTVQAGSTATLVITDLVEATDEHFTGRTLIFIDGALKGQARSITSYVGATKTLVCDSLTELPTAGDTFLIV